MTEPSVAALRAEADSWGYCSWCGWRDAERLPSAPGARVEWACADHWPADAVRADRWGESLI